MTDKLKSDNWCLFLAYNKHSFDLSVQWQFVSEVLSETLKVK